MKFTINVDCTPAEAREFIGLPNIAPMQDRLVNDLEERIRGDIKKLDLQDLLKTWLPANVQSLTELQKIFWTQMGMTKPDPPNK